MQINIQESNMPLRELVERVMLGEEIIIDKEGTPVAKLIAYRGTQPDTPSVEPGKTLADFLADRIGVLSSSEYIPGGAQMSEDCGKKFAQGMVEKRKRGKL